MNHDYQPFRSKKFTHRKRMRLQIRDREQHWDNRIYKNILTDLSQIPIEAFSKSQEHPHAMQPQRYKKQFAMHESTQDKSYVDQKGAQLQFSNAFVVQKYIRMQEKLPKKSPQDQNKNTDLEQKLEQMNSLWASCKIPPSHSNELLNILDVLAPEEQLIQVNEEITLLERKQSPVQRCVYSISAREKCLKVFQQHISQIQTIMQFDSLPRNSQIDFVRRSSELLLHIRLLSLNVVEGIQSWRQYIQSKRQLIGNNLDKAYLHYETQDGIIYIAKMVEDYQMIRSSILINFLELSSHSDPFLIGLLKEHHVQIHGPDDNKSLREMLNRVRKCEIEILKSNHHSKLSLIKIQTNQSQKNLQPHKEVDPEQHKDAQSVDPQHKDTIIIEHSNNDAQSIVHQTVDPHLEDSVEQPPLESAQQKHEQINHEPTSMEAFVNQHKIAIHQPKRNIKISATTWDDIIQQAQSMSDSYITSLRVNFIPERKRPGSGRIKSGKSLRIYSDQELDDIIRLKQKQYQCGQTPLGQVVYSISGNQMFVLVVGSELPSQEQYLIDCIMDIASTNDAVTEIEFNMQNLSEYLDPYKKFYQIQEHILTKVQGGESRRLSSKRSGGGGQHLKSEEKVKSNSSLPRI